MKKKLVLVGAGGFGREVLWQINEHCANEYEVMGFVDNSCDLIGRYVGGMPVLGDDDWLLSYDKEICVAICIANPKIRRGIYNRLKKNSLISFPTIVADGVVFSDTVRFGQGCIICLSTILTVDVALGDFVIVNPNCSIAHDTIIDDFVTLYYNVNIAGNARIHDYAEIGMGVNIIQGMTIGEGAVIGAGAVVVRDIPKNCVAVGVPAASRERERESRSRNRSHERIGKHLNDSDEMMSHFVFMGGVA